MNVGKYTRSDGTVSFKVRGYNKGDLYDAPAIIVDGNMDLQNDGKQSFYAFGGVPRSEVEHLVADLQKWLKENPP